MCDCYAAPCVLCGKLFQIHLGDYATGRGDIAVYCLTCWLKNYKPKPFIPVPHRFTFSDKGGINKGEVIIVALTSSVENLMTDNHPNYWNSEEIPLRKENC